MHEGATHSARRAEKSGTRPGRTGLGECEWRDTCGSDVPPLDVVESLTWIGRKVSLAMGHGTCTGESVALAGGLRHCSRLAAWHLRPRLGEGDSTPI